MMLPGCKKWHPGEHGEIVRRLRTMRGKVAYRRMCLTCKNIRQMLGYEYKRPSKPSAPYGVLPSLNWKPPEGVIYDGY